MLRSVRWYARELERRERAWAAERGELVATICRLAGKGLPPAPAEPRTTADLEPVADRFQVSPEQLPV
jgi:hypothetical protein